MTQRLIDADRLKRHYAWWGEKASAEIFKEFKHTFDIIVDLQPTVEVHDIVRCEECVHYWKNFKDGEPDYGDEVAMCLCSPKDDAFCSEGERREDAEHT